jgi:hypothetical protein
LFLKRQATKTFSGRKKHLSGQWVERKNVLHRDEFFRDRWRNTFIALASPHPEVIECRLNRSRLCGETQKSEFHGESREDRGRERERERERKRERRERERERESSGVVVASVSQPLRLLP